MAKKKAVKKGSAKVAPKVLPAPMSSAKSCRGSGDAILCKISLVMAVLFVMSAFQAIGTWAIGVSWWIWLALAIIIGWKPLMGALKK